MNENWRCEERIFAAGIMVKAERYAFLVGYTDGYFLRDRKNPKSLANTYNAGFDCGRVDREEVLDKLASKPIMDIPRHARLFIMRWAFWRKRSHC